MPHRIRCVHRSARSVAYDPIPSDAANMKLDAQLALLNARINVAYSFYNLKYVTASL